MPWFRSSVARRITCGKNTQIALVNSTATAPQKNPARYFHRYGVSGLRFLNIVGLFDVNPADQAAFYVGTFSRKYPPNRAKMISGDHAASMAGSWFTLPMASNSPEIIQ